jgi:pimeloyl-ACP methyl ester carboxylesterase
VQRLQRVQRRPVLIIYGENDAPGKLNSLAGAEILKDLGEHPRILEIPHIGHTDLWIETQSAPRDEIRAWMADVVKTRVKSRCGAVV